MRNPCDSSQPVIFVDILLRHAVLFAKFLGGQPLVEMGRLPVVERVDVLIKRLFLFRRALEKEQDVVDGHERPRPGRDN